MRNLNLNNYVAVKEGENPTLCITPMMLADGTQPPKLYFKTVRAAQPVANEKTITSGDVTWYPKVKLDVTGSPKDYIELVYWWFETARQDEVYRNELRRTYGRLPTFSDEVEKARNWLVTDAAYYQTPSGRYKKRKKDIDAYLKGWLGRVLDRQLYPRRK